MFEDIIRHEPQEPQEKSARETKKPRPQWPALSKGKNEKVQNDSRRHKRSSNISNAYM